MAVLGIRSPKLTESVLALMPPQHVYELSDRTLAPDGTISTNRTEGIEILVQRELHNLLYDRQSLPLDLSWGYSD
jgi:hypothetical protein